MWMLAGWLVVAAADPGAWTVAPDGRSLRDPQGGLVPIGCDVRAVLGRADAVYAACPDRVVRLALHPDGTVAASEAVPVQGVPVGLFERSGAVWVEVDRREAHPLGPVPSGSAPVVSAPVAASPQATPSEIAHVTADQEGLAVLDRGTASGFDVGDHVELYREIVRDVAGRPVVEEREITVALIVGAADDVALVRLGVNEEVPLGGRARLTERSTQRAFLAPPRMGGQGFASLTARGMVSISDSGGAVLLGANVGYRFKFPMAIEARVAPLDVGAGTDGAPEAWGTVIGVLSFDHPLFAIGVGGGVSTVVRATGSEYAYTPEGSFPVVAQALRLGARDGLMMSTYVQFRNQPDAAWVDNVQQMTPDGTTRWVVDDIDGTFQIPLSGRRPPVWLLLHGTGGIDGGFGELGVRIRMRGTGTRGTYALTPLIGGGGFRRLFGPTVGLGIDGAF